MIIARAVHAEFAFMIDDSMLAKNAIKVRRGNTNKKCSNYSVVDAVNLLEGGVKKLSAPQRGKLGLISLRRFGHPARMSSAEAVIGFCQGFQYLNITSLFAKGVYFRRKLFYGEDIAFTQQCLNSQLAAIQLPHIEYYDHSSGHGDIGSTGCNSPYLSCAPAVDPSTAALSSIVFRMPTSPGYLVPETAPESPLVKPTGTAPDQPTANKRCERKLALHLNSSQ